MDFTIVIPTRDRPDHAHACIDHCLSYSNLNILVLDDNSEKDIEYTDNSRVRVIKNKFKSSLCSIWNQGITETNSEGIIILSHKARPLKFDFELFFDNINKKYALVSVKGFHFFGCYKYLFNKIGMFDSNAPYGGDEDNDFLRRMYEANLAWFISDAGNEVKEGSSWKFGYEENRKYFDEKWNCIPLDNKNYEYKLVRLKRENSPRLEKYYPNREFLPFHLFVQGGYGYKRYIKFEDQTA